MRTKAQYVISVLIALTALISLCGADALAITREQVIQNAKRYANYKWTVRKGNTNSKWNRWKVGQKVIGVPYNWGGYDTLKEFERKIKEGKIAGDSKKFKDAKRKFAGVDCSGFVSRALEISQHTTLDFKNKESVFPRIGWENLKPGDIINCRNSKTKHVRLFHCFTDGGRAMYYESTTGNRNYKVVHRSLPRENGYIAMRYKNIKDGPVSHAGPTSPSTATPTSPPSGPAPAITEVRPNPLPPLPSGQRQWITIYGKNFTRNSKIELEIIGEKKFGKRPKQRLAYESDAELRYHINVGPKENEWSARVNNDGQVSNACSFKVAYAPASAIPESHEKVREEPPLEPYLSKPESPEPPAEEEPEKNEAGEAPPLELYLSKPEEPEPPERPENLLKPDASPEKPKDIISQSVYNLIQSASEKALLLRRDIVEIPHIEKRHNIAIQLENTRLIEGYEKQLKEKKENIRLGLSDYENIIRSLAEADPKTVSEQFNDYANRMTDAGRFDKVKVMEVIHRHHQEYLRNRNLNLAKIQQDFNGL